MNTAGSTPTMNGIHLGTGTGTPAVTDSGLFNRIAYKSGTRGSVEVTAVNQYSMTITTVFSENEANGLLTEVGVGYTSSDYQYDNVVYTHAMFTDAEGHPIAIEKTNTDRLTVVATLYLNITYPDSLIPFPPGYNLNLIAIPANDSIQPASISLETCPYLVRRCFGRDSTHFLALALADMAGFSCLPLSIGFDRQTTQTGIRLQGYRVASADLNLPYTYQIKSVNCELGQFPLPNHALFPPLPLELEAVGDGVTTGFNFGIAELMPEVRVYIDDVLQPANTYTWNGKDFNLRQAWASQNGTYLVSQPRVRYEDWSGWVSPVAYGGNGSYYWATTPIFTYDFRQAKLVNELRCSSSSGTPGTCILYKSDDNETWTEVARLTGMSGDRSYNVTFSPVSARYWKLEFNRLGSRHDFNGAGETIGAFDFVTNQLEFNTPPASGSVIKIEAKSEYPIKNENWIIDQIVIDYSFSRGGS